ncbi:hypothetical protein [Burkholderia sp. BCC1977]|uniref:hypothetical protein n=2 Tax=Burkholderia TaxID=32008 RepID=UPI0039F21A9C
MQAACQLAARAMRYGASASVFVEAERREPTRPAATGNPARLMFRCGCLASPTGTFEFFSAKGRTMKKTLASIMTAAFALASVSAFAQEAASAPAGAMAPASAPMKKDHSKPKHQLKQHGSAKGKAKAAAASAAGTNDAGAAN